MRMGLGGTPMPDAYSNPYTGFDPFGGTAMQQNNNASYIDSSNSVDTNPDLVPNQPKHKGMMGSAGGYHDPMAGGMDWSHYNPSNDPGGQELMMDPSGEGAMYMATHPEKGWD